MRSITVRTDESKGETFLNLQLNLRILLFALAAATASGVAFGLVPAWLASRTDVNDALKQGSRGTTGDRTQHRMLSELPASDPMIITLVAMLLVAMTLFACWLPARRAAKVDPMVALRNE